MPSKTHKPNTKTYPKHFAKVYWPYLPLVLVVGAGLWLGRPTGDHSQNSLVHQASQINQASLLAETNQARASKGIPALQVNNVLSKAAATQASSMVTKDSWSKSASQNNQNLAYGFDTSAQAVSGWMSSSEQRASLLDASYSQVGFGVASSQNYLQKGPETVIVAIYGGASAPAAAIANSATAPILSDAHSLSFR